MAETATLPQSVEPTPIPDLGMFADAPAAATPSPAPISENYPDLGMFASAPPAGTPPPMPPPEPDLGIFSEAPQRPPQAGDEAAAALAETPTILRSPAQVDYLDAKMVREGGAAVSIPKMSIEQADPWPEKAGKAAYNTVAGFAEGMTSADAVNGLLNPLLGVSELAASVPNLINQVRAAEKTPPNSPQRWEAGAQIVGFLALPAVVHAFSKGKPNVTEAAKTEVPPPVETTTQEAPLNVETSNPITTGGTAETAPSRSGEVPGASDGPAPENAVAQDMSAPGPTGTEEAPQQAPDPVVQKWTGATEVAPTVEEVPPAQPTAPQPMELASGIPMPKFDITKQTTLDRATGSRSATLQRSTQETMTAQADLRKAVPAKPRREAIAVYREAGGDPKILADWAARAKSKWMKKAAADAQNLTPQEIAAAKLVENAYDVMAKRGTANGVLKSHRDNYVTHVWKLENPYKGFGVRALKQRFAFSKARAFATFFEGDQAGFTPKTLDVADLVPGYIAEMNRVIADRNFVNSLVGLTGSDGRPLVIPRGRISTVVDPDGNPTFLARPDAQNLAMDAKGNPVDQSDYRVMDKQPALRRWAWRAKDSEGNPILMEGDLALHPEAYRRINAMMGDSRIRQWYREGGGAMSIPKKIARGLDLSQSVLKREMFSLISAFHQVQEGTHAVGHLVNPFFGLKEFDTASAPVAEAMQNGLMLLSDRTAGMQFFEGLGSKKSLTTRGIRKIPLVGKTLADVSEKYQEYLFGSYIPRLKYATYEKILARNTKRFADELKSGEVTSGDVGRLSAEQTNAAYGHLNYALLDRDPTFQHFLQISLLAPDFLEARGKFVAQAAKGITSKVGSEQLKAVAVLAATQAGVSYTLAQLTGGEWDPSRPFEFSLKGRSYTLRSVPEDLFDLAGRTREFVSARINPAVQTGIQALTGRNYRGEKVTATDTLEEYFAKYIPIVARSVPGIRELTETSKNDPISPLERLAGSLGIKIHRKSPISDTYKLADKWMKDQGQPSDTGSYPTSKYQQLRYALEDADDERIDSEYAKLKEAMSADKIAKGFKESVMHPFTGSKDMDKTFRDSLSDEDKAVYDLAVRKREDMMARFKQIQ